MLAFVVDLSAGFSQGPPDVQGSKHPTGADLPPWDAVALLRRELALYHSELPVTPALVVANKIDRLQDPDAQLQKLRCRGRPAPYTLDTRRLLPMQCIPCVLARSHGRVLCDRSLTGMLVMPVSALKGHGLQEVQAAIRQLVAGSSRYSGGWC